MSEPSTYLAGHLAPLPDEIDATDLTVTGTLPTELTGRYFRNGPNPLPGEDAGHQFVGHGMIHGVRLVDGRAEWYRNRWVRTRRLDGAPLVRADGTIDLAANPANTHVIQHGERILALCEVGLPYLLTPELDTVGPCDFDGRLTTAVTAHPKQDPVTGELHLFGYGVTPPYLTYHRLSAAGELVETREVEVPGPTMMHDFAITERHLVWLDLPVVFDPALLGAGLPYRWDDGYGARVGVLRRDGGARVTWFDVDPCYVFHVGNAHEDADGRIVLDVVRYGVAEFADLWSRLSDSRTPAATAARSAGGRLHRWVLDPVTATRREQPLDDRAVEFPTLNEARIGRTNRYLYVVGEEAIGKYDTHTGETRWHHLGAGRAPDEAVFVPAADARSEDEGWLLSVVSDRAGSDLLVLDAAALTAQATVRLPRRVPAGFHGSWIPDPAGG
jgi:carotenoid cleavage dioxygenase